LYLGLFKITNAPITPGIHPRMVNIKIIKNEPHPLSTTAKGGNTIDKITRQILILIKFIYTKILISYRYLNQNKSREK